MICKESLETYKDREKPRLKQHRRDIEHPKDVCHLFVRGQHLVSLNRRYGKQPRIVMRVQKKNELKGHLIQRERKGRHRAQATLRGVNSPL